MNLKIPPEPLDLKNFIMNVRIRLESGDDIDSDALAVWFANKFPGYLWQRWKQDLQKYGINWQKFLKILKLHTNDIILWALQNKLSWEELIKRIIDTLNRYSNKL